MSSEIREPALGLSSSDEASGNLPRGAAPPPEDSLPDLPPLAASPAPRPSGTSSADELALSLGQISPDPYLDEFQPEPAPAPAAAVSDSPFDVSEVAAALDRSPTGRPAAQGQSPRPGPPPAVSPPPSTSEHFVGLDLGAPPPSKGAAAAARRKQATNDAEGASLDDDDEILPAPRSSWLMALLASYASAVTLGLIWVVWGHRVARESAPVEPDPFPTAESTANPGLRAGQSRKYVASEPLPADRIVMLDQSIVIDALEVTPLEVRSGPVILRRRIRKLEARRGGNDALMLELRFKNVSSDSILVPLDEAFIRASRGVRDSFIEAGPSQQIDMFPLAIVSEWAIAGQEFRELRPGESYETAVVSAPDALDHVAPEMTWRLRLHTGINQSGTLGIRFRKEDIRRMSPRETPDLPEQPEPGDSPAEASANQER